MRSRSLAGAALALMVVLAVACGTREPPLTPEAARAKGDAMLKQMSQTLAGTQAFSFRTDQELERAGKDGQKKTQRFSRQTTIRRPNQVALTDSGSDRDGAAWYDGKQLTIVSNRDKIWVRGPMPATLDEAMDFISAEYAVHIAAADLLYSNPYEALVTAETTGGWVNVEHVGERSCEHLSYQQPLVDWQLWLAQDDRRLPCQLQITYKADPGQPMSRIVFHDWNQSPAITDATFTPSVPEGYRRIKLMRHATVLDESAKAQGGSHD